MVRLDLILNIQTIIVNNYKLIDNIIIVIV